jgi:hypothetical protein
MARGNQSRTRLLHAFLVLFVLWICGAHLWLQKKRAETESLRLFEATIRTSFCVESKPLHHPICNHLPHGGAATASSLWYSSLIQIHNASIHPRDTQRRLHANWTRQLLQFLAPNLLEQGLRASPSYTSLEPIFTKLYHRLVNDSAPPLKIIVFGGSTAEGVGCSRVSKELFGGQQVKTKGTTGQGRNCAWPFRLQVFLDQFLGQGVIEINNLAVGGSTSDLTEPFLKYWLYPPFFRPTGPDIVINAHSTNDNNPPAFHYATLNTTGDDFHANRFTQRNQDFIETAINSRHCTGQAQPLVLYVDEYMGNIQDVLLGDGQGLERMQLLADMFPQVGLISPASAVRPFVFADIWEVVFSPNWKKAKGGSSNFNNSQTAVNVHFGLSGHVTIMWVVAYAMLQLTLDFCEDSRGHHRPAHVAPSLLLSSLAKTSQFLSIAKTPPKFLFWNKRQEIDETEGSAQSPAAAPLGVLSNISNIWRESVAVKYRDERMYCESRGQTTEQLDDRTPCVFAFLAAPLGTHGNQDDLNNYLRPFIMLKASGGGWEARNDLREDGFVNKLGLVATRPDATVTLALRNLQKPVRVITLHTLKSFGEKWLDARAKFTLEVFEKGLQVYMHEFVIEGVHNQNTSISYPFRLDLHDRQASVGSTIRFRIDLIGGTTFKINALMFCSR